MSDNRPQEFHKIATVPDTLVGQRSPGFEHVQAFLQRFGYLPSGRYSIGELDTTTSEALQKYQEFSSLLVTGHFDTATREQMMLPRCGLPDFQEGLGLGKTCRWDHTNLTYAFDTGTKDILGGAEWDAIRAAFRTWQALGPVTFTEVNTNQNPEIQAGWRPANDPDWNMVGPIIAHADYPLGCGWVTNTFPLPLHFDDTENIWSIGEVVGAFDIETVALHVIGHILGLPHSSGLDAVMGPTFSSQSTKRALTQNDINAFRSLWQWGRFTLAPPGSASPTGGITAVSRIPTGMELWWIGQDGSVQDSFWYG